MSDYAKTILFEVGPWTDRAPDSARRLERSLQIYCSQFSSGLLPVTKAIIRALVFKFTLLDLQK
jgi:hypothetical protein